MQVQLVLESPHTVWTNLDFIKGRVILRLPSVTPISSIVVKLEGESRTRLMSPGHPDMHEKPKPQEEIHKLLYRLATVFPPDQGVAAQRHYTLNPGLYEYPFEFKIPFNNTCSSASTVPNLKLSGLSLEIARAPTRHVKTTLPPTLTTFPGLAEIRYFLKVTVNRKEFYKENPRVCQNFNFLPIEPPRTPSSGTEIYARRQHQFTPDINFIGPSKTSLINPFRKSFVAPSSDPPKISLDARLPSPAIITCNEDVPLRLIVKRLDASTEQLFLWSLQIELIGHTQIRAHDVIRNETNSWVVVSLNNVGQSLNQRPQQQQLEKVPESHEIVIDAHPWTRRPLPSSVAPSFETCNIIRKYELEVRAGIGYGGNQAKNLTILPLRLPVSVFSGISPPTALLASMLSSPYDNTTTGTTPPRRKPVPVLHTSLTQGGPSTLPGPSAPPPGFAPLPQGEEEPPPSYEDAVGLKLPPVDGPRREYLPPALPANAGGFERDEVGRRGS